MTQVLGSRVPEGRLPRAPQATAEPGLQLRRFSWFWTKTQEKKKKPNRCRLFLAQVKCGVWAACGEFALLGGPAPQQAAPCSSPCRIPLSQVLVRPRDLNSSGMLEFLKPLPSEPEKIMPGWSVETLKPGMDTDWLLETGYAMGVKTGTSS